MTQKDDPTIMEALDGAANAIKRGDLETGKAGLRWVLERDPNNVLAWLWMSRCTESAKEKLECFNRVLEIEPDNKHALEGIQRFGGRSSSQEPPAAPAVSSSSLPIEDMPKQRSRAALRVAIGGALVAIVFCIGIIAVIGGSDPPATVAEDSAAPIGAEDDSEVLVELPTEIPPSADPATPTNTPQPTIAPLPTDTPIPAVEPVHLEGSGNSVIDSNWPGRAGIAHIVGNAASSNFTIESFDADNNLIDELVDTTKPYDGYLQIDWIDDVQTNRFIVQGVGDWTIDIYPIETSLEIERHMLELPGTFEGNSDDVILLHAGSGRSPDFAEITGNVFGEYFGVFGWGEYGRDVLVNTIFEYDEVILLDPGTLALQINAEGPWSITVTDR